MTLDVPIPLARPEGEVEQIIQTTSKDSANVYFTGHAEQRMKERGFFDTDVFRVLRYGSIPKRPKFSKEHQDWTYVMELRLKSGITLGVVVAMEPLPTDVVVVTVMTVVQI